MFKKPTDKSLYLHSNSYHPRNLKTNIPYGQALRLRKICSKDKDYEESLENLKHSFLQRGYQQNNLNEQFQKASSRNRKNLLQYNENKTCTPKVPFITTYNKQLPKFKTVIEKHWNLLQINEDLKHTFKDPPIYAYRRNKNLRDLIGQTTLVNNKVVRRKELKTGTCRPCLTRYNNLCCKHISSTSSFKSNQTNETFKIFHNTNCRSDYVVYLLECRKCKIQYVGKTETPFNVRLNNHRIGANKQKEDTIPAARHFSQGHNFNQDAKFTIIEQIKDKTKSKEEKRKILLNRENFWITKLKTLTPHGLNQELN